MYYKSCGQCHGLEGAGNEAILAPAIAGLPKWYVISQLKKYQEGARGKHPDDVAGHRMRPMSRTILKEDLEAVSDYVASLPQQKLAGVVEGNTIRGRRYYATCAACHAANGNGNESMKAPPLTGFSDWYHYRQLKHFKYGLRGYDGSKDPTGAIMASMMASIPDEEAMRDVVAYINTLEEKETKKS